MRRTAPRLQPWVRPREAVSQLLSGATARTCLPVALVVGTVLTVVNQGDVVLQGMAGGVVAVKVLANYLIPFVTSSVGALLAVRRRPAPDRRGNGQTPQRDLVTLRSGRRTSESVKRMQSPGEDGAR